MSTSTRIELENPSAYQKKLMDLLGNQNPIEVMSRTADRIAAIVGDYDGAFLRRKPFEGKWSPAEVIGHLADTEWVFGFRIRMMLCHERPRILGMDQDLWVAGQRRNEIDGHQLLAEFRDLRQWNLELWRRMTPADLERVGLHEERGPETLGLMMKMEAGHDLSHIDQISRYIAALNS